MENLFDCLCSLLLHAPNRELFLKGEGLQLMNLMLREKKESRNGALKVLDHALIGPEGKELCAKVGSQFTSNFLFLARLAWPLQMRFFFSSSTFSASARYFRSS